MGQVIVTIAGRAYRMACEDGEETRLGGLAGLVDERIGQMRATFGEIGDQRLIVMAAISVADELGEVRQKLERALSELEQARTEADESSRSDGAWSDQVADGLERAAERLEQIAREMNAAGKE